MVYTPSEMAICRLQKGINLKNQYKKEKKLLTRGLHRTPYPKQYC